MRSLACLSFAAGVVVAATYPAFAGAVSVNGSWAGEMRQIDPDRETRYPMTMTLKGKTGASSYPTLNCTGALTKIAETKSGYTIYQEKVANNADGHCIDGVVAVTTDAGKLVLGWFSAFEGSPSLASATLEKDAN